MTIAHQKFNYSGANRIIRYSERRASTAVHNTARDRSHSIRLVDSCFREQTKFIVLPQISSKTGKRWHSKGSK